MQFEHDGHMIQLTGVQPKLSQCSPVSFPQLTAMARRNSVLHVISLCAAEHTDTSSAIPLEIQQLMDQFLQYLLLRPPCHRIVLGIIPSI